MEQILMGSHFQPYEREEGDWGQPEWIYKSKLCLTNLTAFCDEVNDSVDKMRSMDAVYLDFRRSFNMV